MKKIIPVFVFFLILSGCAGREVSDDFFAMDTYMTAKLSGTQADADAVRNEIYRLDNLLGYDSMDITSDEVKELIKVSEKISAFTDGAFDINISPVLEVWGVRSKEYRIPSSEEIHEALNTVSETPDFGAIGKGYAGEKVYNMLKDRGVKSAIISLGGNIQTVGARPDGASWKVGIQDPDGEGYVGYVSVKDCAVVTSGGYQRFFEVDANRYSHIINPETGIPAKPDLKSVTIISKSGTLADALATAFYVMGVEKTVDFCEKAGFEYEGCEFSVIIIDNNDKVICLGDADYTEKENN